MLTQDQFAALSHLLKIETAVVLESGKAYLVESRLSCLAQEEGFQDIAEMIDVVLKRSDLALNQRVLLALTTNETSFFRDASAFQFLTKTVLPDLCKSRAQTKTLNIWSAACSTGQEPYSIAMGLDEFYPDLEPSKINIRASDLNPKVVHKAARGVYSDLEVGRGLSFEVLNRYFVQHGSEYQVIDRIRKRVQFFEQNLISSWPVTQVDILFMRNVLIYFDTETKRQIFNKIKSVLAPDGYLFLGVAETPYRIVEGFTKVGGATNVYRRVMA